MKKLSFITVVIFLAALICSYEQSFAASPAPAKDLISKHSKKPVKKTPPASAGRYLLQMAGCNDCHTRGYMMANGNVSESDWLTGDVIGWWGPWGTTYAPNLRLFFKNLTEDAWIKMAHNLSARPPMPWYTVRQMKDRDLKAIYRFIKGLGPKEEFVPQSLPPDKEPIAPYFHFVPGPPG